jgi:hypothetical protein
VGEGDIPDILVCEDDVAGMAFVAVAGYCKGFSAIVAGAAGFSSLHYFHADVIAVALFFEEFRVALVALGAMLYMAENDLPDGFGLYVDFVDHFTYISHAYRIQGGRKSD